MSWKINDNSFDLLQIDTCNRLWIVDTGIKEGSTSADCPAQLLAFDLDTDDLIRRIEIPEIIARNSLGESLLANIVVETDGPDCEETTVSMFLWLTCRIIFNTPDV